jgi:hypothetical protein
VFFLLAFAWILCQEEEKKETATSHLISYLLTTFVIQLGLSLPFSIYSYTYIYIHISLNLIYSTMKLSVATTLAAVAAIAAPVHSFAPQSNAASIRVEASSALFATMADSGVPPTTAEVSAMADEIIPTNLPSECGMDYVPLATMLASGQLAEADQVGFIPIVFYFYFTTIIWMFCL